MQKYYKTVKDLFDQKVYIVLFGPGTPKLYGIYDTEIEAINSIKSSINKTFFNYGDEDIEAIKEGKESYDQSVEQAINYIKNYQILTVFGIDINKRIYKNINHNDFVFDISNIVTNSLNRWKLWNQTEDDPNDFYYIDYKKDVSEENECKKLLF
jgi:hypothetical protein